MERLADYLLRLYPIDHVPFKRRIILHAIFWGFFFISLLFGTGFPSDSLIIRLIGAFSFTLTSSTFFYLFNYFIPYLYAQYIGWFRVIVICSAIIAFYFFMSLETYLRVVIVIENHWITPQNKRIYEIYHNVYESNFWSYFDIINIITDTIQLIFTALPAFFLKFVRIFAKVLSEKKQLEIDFLRLQINPHFLVNTLNNIYSLVVIGDQRSPDAILSLSNLLDYVLYESSLSTVSVEKEVAFLKDFVALEQIRNSSKVQVKLEIEGDLTGVIAPLILIAFIENAFKHGIGDSTIQSYVHIKIRVESNTLFLGVINSKVRKLSQKQKNSLGGIGLINVQKRLNSLYPNRYSLQVIADPNKHQIMLSVTLA
ncbi:histidine kinase [Arcicella aurantiaca]|uniref:Histidine kinase n=1 Tax=Arcicella aurantiaca TaxID=591202 RepID=A0A316DIK0_9BACT|nr:histidine kinase [Arcicella aurantiaca]PWK18087.1 histidine kinase [Arcicella aurantiaca]